MGDAPEELGPEAINELLDCLQPGEIAYVWQSPSYGSPPGSDETECLTLPDPLVIANNDVQGCRGLLCLSWCIICTAHFSPFLDHMCTRAIDFQDRR